MLKELTVKEALQLLAEKYPEPVEGWFWDNNPDKKQKLNFQGVQITGRQYFVANGDAFSHFAIEVPDEYRYMTQQECLDWICLHGYKGYQVNYRGWESKKWQHPQLYAYTDVKNWLYRTVQEVDGKIVYGEPIEFKVRVE